MFREERRSAIPKPLEKCVVLHKSRGLGGNLRGRESKKLSRKSLRKKVKVQMFQNCEREMLKRLLSEKYETKNISETVTVLQ